MKLSSPIVEQCEYNVTENCFFRENIKSNRSFRIGTTAFIVTLSNNWNAGTLSVPWDTINRQSNFVIPTCLITCLTFWEVMIKYWQLLNVEVPRCCYQNKKEIQSNKCVYIPDCFRTMTHKNTAPKYCSILHSSTVAVFINHYFH